VSHGASSAPGSAAAIAWTDLVLSGTNLRLFSAGNSVTHRSQRTDLVLGVFKELIASGADAVWPGEINDRLRELGQPMGTWEVRGELSKLEASGEIVNDAATGAWHLREQRDKQQRLRDTA
jgi:hypothetical protein